MMVGVGWVLGGAGWQQGYKAHRPRGCWTVKRKKKKNGDKYYPYSFHKSLFFDKTKIFVCL